MTASIRVKIAVVPPMPRASVSIAVAVKIGDSLNCRRAYLTLSRNVSMPGLDVRDGAAVYGLHSTIMMKLDRRAFLGTVGAAVVAARPAFAKTVKKVGMQLYTVRTDLEKDFDGTLAKVAAIGYKEVEFAGYFGRTPQQVRDTLKAHGLVSPAAHIDYPTVTDPGKWAKTLDDAAVVGQTFLVNP